MDPGVAGLVVVSIGRVGVLNGLGLELLFLVFKPSASFDQNSRRPSSVNPFVRGNLSRHLRQMVAPLGMVWGPHRFCHSVSGKFLPPKFEPGFGRQRFGRQRVVGSPRIID